MFREIALYLKVREESLKPSAYEKVAYVLKALEEPVTEIYKAEGLRACVKSLPWAQPSPINHQSRKTNGNHLRDRCLSRSARPEGRARTQRRAGRRHASY
jgi:hypothetical protein